MIRLHGGRGRMAGASGVVLVGFGGHGLAVSLVLDVPEHVANENRSPQAAVMTLSGHMEFAEGQVEHPGSLTLVTKTIFLLQAIGVVTDRSWSGHCIG